MTDKFSRFLNEEITAMQFMLDEPEWTTKAYTLTDVRKAQLEILEKCKKTYEANNDVKR